MHVPTGCFVLALLAVALPGGRAQAAWCAGGSRMACYEGIDDSGRSPGALYDAAVDALRDARTQAERALARRAIKDAFDPKMSNQRAVECGRSLGPGRDFAACGAGPGPTPGMRMTISCQQNLSDGRVLVDGSVLPAGARFKLVRYRPASADGGWSHGSCDVEFTRR